MKGKKLDRLCAYLCRRLERRELVTEDLISEYIHEMEGAVRQRMIKLGFDFFDLREYCRTFQSGSLSEEERFSYAVGCVWGASELYREICSGDERKQYEDRLSPDSKLFMVLKTIAEHPGLLRKELLELLEPQMESTALSHITSELQKRGYLLEQRLGREKCFYPSGQGDELVETYSKEGSRSAKEEAATRIDKDKVAIKVSAELSKQPVINMVRQWKNQKQVPVLSYSDGTMVKHELPELHIKKERWSCPSEQDDTLKADCWKGINVLSVAEESAAKFDFDNLYINTEYLVKLGMRKSRELSFNVADMKNDQFEQSGDVFHEGIFEVFNYENDELKKKNLQSDKYALV